MDDTQNGEQGTKLVPQEELKVGRPTTGMASMPEFQPMDDNDSIRIPRLVLVQGGLNNQLVKEGSAKDGDLINSLTKEIYGQELEIVPIAQKKSTRIRWGARADGGGMLCVARDGMHGAGDPGDTNPGNSCLRCPYTNVRKGKKGDLSDDKWCSSNYEIVAMVRSTQEVIMLTADSIKSADQGIRDILGMARIHAAKGTRMSGRSYILKPKAAESNGFNYFKLVCVPGNNNQVLPEDEAMFYVEQSKYFGSRDVDAGHSEDKVRTPDW